MVFRQTHKPAYGKINMEGDIYIYIYILKEQMKKGKKKEEDF